VKKTKSSPVSIRDVAHAAGVSKSTVGRALQNHPAVNAETRQRVLRIAQRLGYRPDARIVAWMASVRDATSKDLLPIAWLNANLEKDAWHRHKYNLPTIQGAQERALQLGYRIEEMWTAEPGVTIAQINRILYQRGIEGVIVTSPARHLRLDWHRMACVSLGADLLVPRLHEVLVDTFYNLLLALKMVKRHGYRRIGICLTEYFHRGSSRALFTAVRDFHATTPRPDKVPPLFYPIENEVNWPVSKKRIASWLSHYRPDVIVCHSNRMVGCVEEAGYRVPEDLGVVHLATDDDVSDWAGVSCNKREMGAIAAELVVALMNSRQFGVPRIARNTAIRGSWHPGCTLLIPKPK
jgi:LacI family transcriptional regulator